MTRRRIRHVPTKTTTTPPPASEADYLFALQQALAQAVLDRERANEAVRRFVEHTGANMDTWSTEQLDHHDLLLNAQIDAHHKAQRLAKRIGVST